MQRDSIRELLERVAAGRLSPGAALEELALLPMVEGETFLADTHRALRTGEGEAVFCLGKTPAQAAAAFAALSRGGGPVLATRASAEHARAILALVPEARHHSDAGMVVLPGAGSRLGRAAVVCAGTSDLPVAEEAAVTAESLGVEVDRVRDVGVAGLHRLLGSLPRLREASAIVAVAGMEGALPSVLAGLVRVPVIAVPTSVGYGAAFGGVAPLLAMLNACAPGIAVVNIDNGFGAGVLLARILAGPIRKDEAR
jgi:NCAIR mutase (PurE)-related protein